jgi:hypothetical protein
MRVSKWVDMGQEVKIEIGVDDVRAALTEGFHAVTAGRLGEPGPLPQEVLIAFNDIAIFLRALSDQQIALLKPKQRELIHTFLFEQTERFSGFSAAQPVERSMEKKA